MRERNTPRIIGILFALLVFGLPLMAWVATVVTDYLWFIDLGQRQVFITELVSEVAIALAFGVVAFALLYANMRVARAMAPKAVLTSVGDMPPQIEEALLRFRAGAGKFLDMAVLWGSLIVAFVVALSMATSWQTIRLAFSGGSFGATDPTFGRDVGFYVFTLPALRLTADWLLGILIFTAIATLVVHVLDGAIQPWAKLRGVAPHVKAHMSVLLSLIIASKAFDYYLDTFELNFSPRGQVVGASYTDIHAQLPALRILIAVALLSAVVLLLNIRVRGWRLPIVAVSVWLIAVVLVGGIYPAAIQKFRVDPNEVSAEAPFIEHNIRTTRQAFGLDTVETRAFGAKEDLTAQDVVANRGALDNVRLWDPNIVMQSYRQLQVIRPYYDFADVDVDRYAIGGEIRQVLVSAREMDVNQLAEQARTWVNQHLVYTHGYGLVMSPVNEADTRGLPDFIIRDIPPQTETGIVLDRPAIYFGERTDNYAIIDAEGIEEFDYPSGEGDSNVNTRYDADSGVRVGGLLRRVAFALRFGASQILFSQYISGDSRVLFDRNIIDRVEKLAPWLWLDEDPYPVVADGRIVWVIDGYTWSNDYPYSERFGGMNYMRNSVKVTIDAYDGTTRLYAFGEPDPILDAWRGIFPTLVTDADEMPEEIRSHLRYPEGLFRVQAEVYKNYHMLDPQVFYNKEDSWELPGERTGTPMEPYYVLMQLPGEPREDFQMILPFTARNRDNMIGWMSAASDPANYGKRVVYQFPRQRVILGPEQVSARINQDETISPQLTLWSQRGSSVIMGNMLVIPLEDSVVYIQPLYLQAEQTAIPQLTRVIVVYADKVKMANNLENALLAVFGEQPPETTTTPEPGGATTARAQQLYEDAIAAQRDGDWARYGELIDELGAVLDSLAASGEPTVTP